MTERPKCRRYIIDQGLSPRVVDGVWDGFRAVSAVDSRLTQVAGGLKPQMRKMILEGYWPGVRLRKRNETVREPEDRYSISFILANDEQQDSQPRADQRSPKD